MSMGHAGAYTDRIEEKKLAKLFPKEVKALKTAVEQSESFESIEQLAREVQDAGGTEDIKDKPVLDALNALFEVFTNRFEGLTLSLCFHDSENSGDCYDQINGVYWDIDGLYVLSDGAKKLGVKNFERKHFVQFG